MIKYNNKILDHFPLGYPTLDKDKYATKKCWEKGATHLHFCHLMALKNKNF